MRNFFKNNPGYTISFICSLFLVTLFVTFHYIERYGRDESYFDQGINIITSELVRNVSFASDQEQFPNYLTIEVANSCSLIKKYQQKANTDSQKDALNELFNFCVEFAQKSQHELSGEEVKKMVIKVQNKVSSAYQEQHKLEKIKFENQQKQREIEAYETLKEIAKTK